MLLTPLQKEIFEKRSEVFGGGLNLEKYFKPDFARDTYDGSKIADMTLAIERIKKAIDIGEKIVIYSDYDCDGIPGAVVLHDFFLKLEESYNLKASGTYNKKDRKKNEFYINFSNYIPHRHKEGYGLNLTAIKNLIADGYTLMITVDCGITNVEEIKYAEENGMNVILTDHHLPILSSQLPKGEQTQILPPAYAAINMKRDDDVYEDDMLCGCATAWKLVNTFLNKYRDEYGVIEGWEKWLLDMVGISTIADMVPLQNENRVLAKYGLEVLRKSSRPGLQKILKNAKIDQKKINEDDIGFGIAPRLNAASRMAEPIHAFYALLANEESVKYAEELERYNDERKQSTKDAHADIDYKKLKDKNIILVGSEAWGAGILGLIASKVVEEVGKTTFVWGAGEDENIMKGSVRSGKDKLNIVQVMTDIQDEYKKENGETLLENFGGHEEAGGFAIQKNRVTEFELYLEKYKIPTSPQPSPKEREKPKYITTDYIYKYIKDGVKEQKRNQSEAEEMLWQEIRNNKLDSKFRRQHVIDMFVPDFVCLEKKLIIEVDGEIHNTQKEHDKERQDYLEAKGYKVLRFTNQEIKEILKDVVEKIRKELENPLLGRGQGEVGDTDSKKNYFDKEISLRDVSRKTFDEIKVFAPFGMKNEKIIFKVKKSVSDIFITKRFGKNSEHLEINLNGVRGIEFFVSDMREEFLKNQNEYLINIEWDNWRGDVVMKFVKM